MRIVWCVLGYLAATSVGMAAIMAWHDPSSLRLLLNPTIAIPYLALGVVFTFIPGVALRLLAVIFHRFDPVTATIGGSATGLALYLFMASEHMSGQPLTVVWSDLFVFMFSGLVAGWIWYKIESFGAKTE